MDCDTTGNSTDHGTINGQDTISGSESYGDEIKRKRDNILRVGFININGVPGYNEHCKNQEIYEAISRMDPCIIGMTEMNRCWKHVHHGHRWNERIRGWWENYRSNISYNYKDCNNTSYQPGGNILLSIGKPTFRIIAQGSDKKGLGRWCWTRYRGRHDITIRVICAYRPCKPNIPGPNTTYSQHQRLFDMTNDNRCPRAAILEDLEREMREWREVDGDQIIMMMDCNENVNGALIRSWLRDNSLHNMAEDIQTSTSHIPATQQRGSHPIDGIFISNTISVVKGGFLPFGEFPF